ncbi:MAG: hypothetical protein WC436_00195 [Candidatus Babeliales bacterium]
MNIKTNFNFFAIAFAVISFFSVVQIKPTNADQDLHNQQDLTLEKQIKLLTTEIDSLNLKTEDQVYSLKQKQIEKLEKQVKLLTTKIDSLNLKIEEQEEVLNLHKNLTTNNVSNLEKKENFSKFNWRKFFTIVTSINARKATLLIIALGVATGIINPIKILKQITSFASRWLLKGIWFICKTVVYKIPTALGRQFKEVLDAEVTAYNADVEKFGYDKGAYNWLVNGYQEITNENGEVIKNFDKPGPEAILNWLL